MIYEYKCQDCHKVIEQTGTPLCHSLTVNCDCGGIATRLLTSVVAIVPYSFKAVKPYTPETGDVKRETEEVCRKKGWDPKNFLDDSFYDGSRGYEPE